MTECLFDEIFLNTVVNGCFGHEEGRLGKILVCIYNFIRKVKFKDVLFCKKYISIQCPNHELEFTFDRVLKLTDLYIVKFREHFKTEYLNNTYLV